MIIYQILPNKPPDANLECLEGGQGPDRHQGWKCTSERSHDRMCLWAAASNWLHGGLWPLVELGPVVEFCQRHLWGHDLLGFGCNLFDVKLKLLWHLRLFTATRKKTPQGKALMDAYAARLKDIKAAFSMRCAAKHREYAVCMLYMYVDISFMYFMECFGISDSQYFTVFPSVWHLPTLDFLSSYHLRNPSVASWPNLFHPFSTHSSVALAYSYDLSLYLQSLMNHTLERYGEIRIENLLQLRKNRWQCLGFRVHHTSASAQRSALF